METNIVLVLLVGLPGSGKTSLCKVLKTYQETETCENIVVIHVCYDSLIPLSVQKEFVDMKKTKEKVCGGSMSEREESNVCVNEKDKNNWNRTEVEVDDGSNCTEGHDIGKDWKGARLKILSQVDQLLQYIKSSETEKDIKSFFGVAISKEESNKYVVLLDDNFYYRSMRYEFFQLARKHSTGFCQLYMECSVEEASWHNSVRKDNVPTDVVLAMEARLQPPKPNLHHWETNTCILKPHDRQVSQAWETVVQSFQCGLSPLEDKEAKIADAHRICSQSVLHQADLCLRAMVKCLIKKELQQTGQERSRAPQVVAAVINAARQAILTELRRGSLEIPSHLIDAVTDNNREEFKAFLEIEIKRKIQD